MKDPLHIVCLDAPSPPDYGGAIDMYYKIRALHEAGLEVVLHYFAYGSGRDAGGLEPYCRSIHAYRRRTGLAGLWPGMPYIVSSRMHRGLIERLNGDDYPILLEGVHSTGIIPFLKNKERRLLVRLHNDEARYYRYLAKSESNLLRKFYFETESRLLDRYQGRLQRYPNVDYACLSQTDAAVFRHQYGLERVFFVPTFVPWQTVTSPEGRGGYCLYQGNLSVPENEKAVHWLVQQVFSKMDLPLVIAGKGPGARIFKMVRPFPHISVVTHPSDAELEGLIRGAHIHVLPSFNRTGVKLKLLHALFGGRFCLTNTAGVDGSGLQEGVFLFGNAAECTGLIRQLLARPFAAADREERTALLSLYDNRRNAERLTEGW